MAEKSASRTSAFSTVKTEFLENGVTEMVRRLNFTLAWRIL